MGAAVTCQGPRGAAQGSGVGLECTLWALILGKNLKCLFHDQKIEVSVNIFLFQSLGDIYLDSLYFPIRSTL